MEVVRSLRILKLYPYDSQMALSHLIERTDMYGDTQIFRIMSFGRFACHYFLMAREYNQAMHLLSSVYLIHHARDKNTL